MYSLGEEDIDQLLITR